MTSTVPFVDLAAQQREIICGVQRDITEILESGAFVGGPEVAAFEAEYAGFVGVRHCVGLANGTDAVELSLRAVGVRPGDEVIAPANTFIATVEAICRAGARPVLVDVDPDALLMDPHAVAAALTRRTAAVVPVHLYGQMAPVEEVVAAVGDVPVVEDAAQSQGATRHGAGSGAVGLVAATSFYPGKNLGAAGDAGAATTDDADVDRLVRLLANHGSERKYVHEVMGCNSRLDALQAVQLRHKLRMLDRWNRRRQDAADRYAELLGDVPGVVLPVTLPGNTHVWHLYVVRVAERDRVLAALHDAGVGAALHYPVPVHLSKAYAALGLPSGSFPVAEAAAEEILSLPMFPHIMRAQQERVVEVLADAVGR